jgi:hypothetical protein
MSIAVAIGMALSIAACGGVSSPSTNVREPFSGTLLPGGETFHAFNVPDRRGEYEIALTTMNPVAVIGIALGQMINVSGTSTCLATASANPFATVGKTIGGQIQQGSYCALVYDANKSLTTPVAYTITVSHP